MTDLEKVLAQAQYTALPLPGEKSSQTTIYSFHEGQLLIVRDPHTCLPDPPLKVTEDRAVDALQFQREFSFNLKGIVSFFVKIFSLGKAKGEFEAKKVSSATVVMGGPVWITELCRLTIHSPGHCRNGKVVGGPLRVSREEVSCQTLRRKLRSRWPWFQIYSRPASIESLRSIRVSAELIEKFFGSLITVDWEASGPARLPNLAMVHARDLMVEY
jgi:hypothetical protein